MSVWKASVGQGRGRGGWRGYRIRWGGWLAVLAGSLTLLGAGPSAAIVGGQSVPIAEFPFQVALYDPHAGSVADGFFCGGVVVDATHVATAAHCAMDEGTGQVTPPGEIAVLAGTAHLPGAGASPGGGAVEDPAAVTTLDPAYEPSINDYDVAVIRLARPLWTGPTPPLDGRSTVAPIAVSAARAAASASATAGLGEPTLSATVSGWGDMRAASAGSRGVEGAYPSDLRAVQVPLVPASTCDATYTGSLSSQPITSRMLCAGALEGGRDSCFGDSGGPLLVGGAPGSPPSDYVLAGLVSFGEGCAQSESPGVYASIANPQIAAFLTSNPPQTPLGPAGRAASARHLRQPAHGHRPAHCKRPAHSHLRHWRCARPPVRPRRAGRA
jgi:secreted trypsin-like serine protease